MRTGCVYLNADCECPLYNSKISEIGIHSALAEPYFMSYV